MLLRGRGRERRRGKGRLLLGSWGRLWERGLGGLRGREGVERGRGRMFER